LKVAAPATAKTQRLPQLLFRFSNSSFLSLSLVKRRTIMDNIGAGFRQGSFSETAAAMREAPRHPNSERRVGFMAKNILVAFDDSENAIRAVQLVTETFSPAHRITLFSVLQDTAALCDLNSPELTPYFKQQQQSFCTLEEKKKSLVAEALKKARQMLLEAGFAADGITLKAEPKSKGVARDIVNEAQSGYDVLVIGRRGISGVREFFFGSVSSKVIQAAKDVSILIVN
jgi:nucleotide-binding universal stress UspA family protein